MSHGTAAIYPGILFGLALLGYFVLLWHWRRWYEQTEHDALAARSVWAVVGVTLLFFSLWLTCGRVAFEVVVLRWGIPATTLAGVACLIKAAAGAAAAEGRA